MNIYDRLKQDHDHHRTLAGRIAQTVGDSAERRELWAEFQPEVEAHANAEEQTFYAALIAEPDGQEKARHSISEHKQAAELLEELSELDMSSSGWLQKFGKLYEELEHHMKEEENEIFARARKLLDESKARQLASDFDERKTQEV